MKSMDGRQDLVDERLKNYFLADARQLFAEQHIDHSCAADTGFHQHHAGVIIDDFSDDLGVAPERMFAHLSKGKQMVLAVTLSDGNNVKYLISFRRFGYAVHSDFSEACVERKWQCAWT